MAVPCPSHKDAKVVPASVTFGNLMPQRASRRNMCVAQANDLVLIVAFYKNVVVLRQKQNCNALIHQRTEKTLVQSRDIFE